MPGTRHLIVFLLAGIALNLTPGQDTLYIIGRSIAQGRTAGIVSVLGIGSGCLVHIVAAAVGLYAVLALSPPLFTAITLLGAAYLMYLGVMTVARRGAVVSSLKPGTRSDELWLVYRQGMLTNLLNPKVALFFIAFLPQFIDPVTSYGPLSFLFLGLVFLCTGTIWCTAVAISASAIADTLRGDARIQAGFEYLTCAIFIGLGASILVSHIL